MADVTVTAANVRPLDGAIIRRFDAGGALDVGDAVYIASDGDVEAADADAAASAQVVGVVVAIAGKDLTTAAAGDAVDVVMFGPVTGFSSLTPGALHYASTTAGAIEAAAPAGASSDFLWIVGKAENATTIFINPFTPDTAAQ